MRVAVVVDMEGASHIGDFREVFPVYPEYWRSGRAKLTADVGAAAVGLLDGGATEVLVVDHHQAGEAEWPNLIEESLPDGTRLAGSDVMESMPEHADAMLQVGCHARAGSPSFVSHTNLLRLRVGGELVSESHLWGWTAGVPVLGIVGSEALGATLGSLADVPFLAVQTGEGRSSARPVHDDPADTAAAIRAFAATAISGADGQRSRTPPEVFEVSIQDADEAGPALAAAGWVRTSKTEFQIGPAAWRDLSDAWWAANGAVWEPSAFVFDGFDPTSEDTALSWPEDRLNASRAWLEAWATDESPEWITPDVVQVGLPA